MNLRKQQTLVNIFHTDIYPNMTKNVENSGKILFTLRLKAWLLGFHCTEFHETHKYR